MLRDEVTLNFDNSGDIELTHPDYPGQLVARVDTEGDIHFEDDIPRFLTDHFILTYLEHELSRALELHEVDWTPDACFLKAASWDIDWTWDDVSRSWTRS